MELMFILAVVLMTSLGIFQHRKEKKLFNNGICSKTGEPWVLFDYSSQGCRGYTDNKGNYLWVSWSVDK